MENLIRHTAMDLVQKPLAKGGTDVFSGKVDMQGYENVMFVGICSSINSTGKVKLRAYGDLQHGLKHEQGLQAGR